MSDTPVADEFDAAHVVVTGGATGIGAAVSLAFRQCRASVTVIGRNEQRLAAFAAENDLSYQAADVADSASVRHAFDRIRSRSGAISILVNNAGMAEAAPFVKTEEELWSRTIDTNLGGVYLCTREVIPDMLQAGGGRVINIASTAALKGYAYVSAYCAAKHGVLGLTRALAAEYARKGITVNAVCPGYTDTDIVANTVENIVATTGRSAEEAIAELVKSNPQGRLIKPLEVANTVLWLAGANSASITGQAIAVAGGETS